MELHGPNLPDFPWDTIAGESALARAHPDGVCDLSIGTPVDPTPDIARQALASSADAPGYPTVWGTADLRASIRSYVTHKWGAPELTDQMVCPTIGAKEAVAWLPTMLGIRAEHTVVVPHIAYPTYAVGAALVGARIVTASSPDEVDDVDPALVWINSPSNPTGRVASKEDIAAWVAYARGKGALLASDECYGEFAWEADAVSVLDKDVNDGSVDGLVSLFSLSKRSNVAGYRAGFVVGDPQVSKGLLEVRKHAGMMVPDPVQAAMAVLLRDQWHVASQRARYSSRRTVLSRALKEADFRIDDSQGGLYLWATRGENGRQTARWFAERGILVAPGDFYGEAGKNHVRIALTATDERIQTAAIRLR